MHQDAITKEAIKLQADLCKALSDSKRLFIIHELRRGERTVTELTETLGLKQSNTSQHLAILRRIGIVSPRREGNTVYYKLVNPKIAEACDLVHDVILKQLQDKQLLSRFMQNSI